MEGDDFSIAGGAELGHGAFGEVAAFVDLPLVVTARRLTEAMADAPKMHIASRREGLGQRSVMSSDIKQEVSEAVDDWFEAMPHAGDEVSGELQKWEVKETHDG